MELCKELPAHLPAALFVAIHLPSTTPSLLPRILSRSGPLKAVHPEDGETIRKGIIYVAPSDYHLDVDLSHVHLSHGPQENGFRPAIDRLFRTAAKAYGPRVIGVVLSGMLSDGALGLLAIQEAGGFTIVQDPQDAMYPSMPENALRSVTADAVLPLDGIAAELIRMAGTPVIETVPDQEQDVDVMEERTQKDKKAYRQGKDTSPRSLITCPSCGGVLWELKEGGQIAYICQIGHRFSLESVFEKQAEGVETALWAAVRALEERGALTHRLAEASADRGRERSTRQVLKLSQQAEQNAQVIRQILEQSQKFFSGNGSEATGDSESLEDGMN